MAQVVVWARREHLNRHRRALSDAIHGAVMAALDYPPDKRAADLELGHRVDV